MIDDRQIRLVSEVVKARGAETVDQVVQIIADDQHLALKLVETTELTAEIHRRQAIGPLERRFLKGEHIDHCIALRKQGKTWREIGYITGFDGSGVRKLLIRHDADLR